MKVGIYDMGTETVPSFDVRCECAWCSTAWPALDPAKGRAKQHADEHATGVPAMELADFRASVGVDPTGVPFDAAGAVLVIDSAEVSA